MLRKDQNKSILNISKEFKKIDHSSMNPKLKNTNKGGIVPITVRNLVKSQSDLGMRRIQYR